MFLSDVCLTFVAYIGPNSRTDDAEDAADAVVRNAEVAWPAAGLEHRRRCQPLQLIRPAAVLQQVP